MVQTGWQRSIQRNADDQVIMGTSVGANIGGSVESAKSPSDSNKQATQTKGATFASSGHVGGSLGFESADKGIETESAAATLDIVNYDVRQAIRAAERAASHSQNPETTFATELGRQITGDDGLRARYLEDARAGRGTTDLTGPITSIDQNSILESGRFALDPENGTGDGKK
jgi:conjugal transfer mating pair stabilization protein TraG